MHFIDSRVPVALGSLDQAGPQDALLREAAAGEYTDRPGWFIPEVAHPPGCACCASRSPAARALTRLLHDRARAKIDHFQRVLVVTTSQAARAEVADALARDPVVSACFRLEP